jgi:D-sedoheptulose 7-phosphate isomerase
LSAIFVDEFMDVLRHINLEELERVFQILHRARERGAMYLAGKGGSAATASHWANDLGKTAKAWGRLRFAS